jgi:hypothetical protein
VLARHGGAHMVPATPVVPEASPGKSANPMWKQIEQAKQGWGLGLSGGVLA